MGRRGNGEGSISRRKDGGGLTKRGPFWYFHTSTLVKREGSERSVSAKRTTRSPA
jgi:hypothetical protein